MPVTVNRNGNITTSQERNLHYLAYVAFKFLNLLAGPSLQVK